MLTETEQEKISSGIKKLKKCHRKYHSGELNIDIDRF